VGVFKRIAKWILALSGLIALLALAGIIWLIHSVQSNLLPPPDPVGQQSIASYAGAESTGSIPLPVLVKDFSWDSISNPPISSRPWTRWWWPGGGVEAGVLLEQLEVLDSAGFGGAEVQPFAMGMQAVTDEAVLKRVYSFDEPAYYSALKTLLTAAAARDWQLDLTHSSGWPAGGPEVNLDDSISSIVYGETNVTGGKKLSIEVPKPRPGASDYIFAAFEFFVGDFINFPAENARLLSVIATKALSGKHASNPFNLGDTVTLDPRSTQVLTASVDNGVLNWDAPAGDWLIIASYSMPSGEVPINAAQKPAGFVVDPLRKLQVIGHYEYAFGPRTGLPEEYGAGLRGFFNDSLEFRLKRMGVDDILPEFRARRGYDLEPLLPAIYIEGFDNFYFRDVFGIHAQAEFQLTNLDDRIRYDYQRTLSDLIIERFVETSAHWAQERGLSSRGQSYGMDIDILRALGANTIPETEQLWAGGSDLVLKMASSAAALYGKPLVSAEAFVWQGEDYTTTARKLKAASDKLFIAGINHIVYHGTPYPWRAGEPSPLGDEKWAPFSGPQNQGHFSSIVAPGNTQLWPDIADINRYIARSQNLLRQGAPAFDVLVYYPFLGFSGTDKAGKKHTEFLLDGALPGTESLGDVTDPLARLSGLQKWMNIGEEKLDERGEWVRQIIPILQELDRRGISWAWVNADAIQSGKVGVDTLPASGGHYQALLLPNVETMEQATLQDLAELAGAGAAIYVAGSLPARQPGFAGAQQGDRAVQALAQALLASGAQQAPIEAGPLADVLQGGLQRPVSYDRSSMIRNFRRDLGEGSHIYFFANQSAGEESLKLQVSVAQPLWWFDPLQGVAWPADTADDELDLQLNSFSSRFLIAGIPLPGTLPALRANEVLFETSRQTWPLTAWRFSGTGASEQAVGKRALSEPFTALMDWRDIPALQHARGPVIYTQQFALKSKIPEARYLLNLGLVQGSALVKINDREMGRASIPPFIVDISTALQQGENLIEIEVLAPLRNYFVGRALAGDPKYSQMMDFAGHLAPAGLMGPVAIAEVLQAPDLLTPIRE
jgi:alpha-L-rhamnosidase